MRSDTERRLIQKGIASASVIGAAPRVFAQGAV